MRDNGIGNLKCYDLWDEYEFIHTSMHKTSKTIKDYGLQDIITLHHQDAFEWCQNPDPFDLMHVDISNDGEKLKKIRNLLSNHVDKGAEILFEGGTKERDENSWIKSYGFKPIESVKNEIGYRVLDERWPGLSLISREGKR